ncbi:hypothetical protein OSCT_3145 [Oscillochloris trichoides DG-6]|uniref:Uncharacterized protein n=1 Tax=Oscillochloris trichoides DG-6 TaxID=765420 RepID=E1IIJ4_9CHLR|nr:hypothetical protein [Oscillochloris trichoides]EFO78984.1 hypothetical protein OSCT_3145 [Oscillochloris trichoides DG-6]
MQNLSFNRWIIIIIVVLVILANGRTLPWPVTMLTLALSGGALLVLAWRAAGWGRIGGGGGRVTYWRGQRIELPGRAQPRMVGRDVWAAVTYALIGLALIAAAVSVVLTRSGI